MIRLQALAALCLLLLLPSFGRAQSSSPSSLIVVLVPGTSLDDWRRADAPALHQMMAQGALAVMNTRSARVSGPQARETPESAALTLSCGSRAAGGPEAADFSSPSSIEGPNGLTAQDLYRRRMGQSPETRGWLNPQWPRVLRENTGRGYDIHPGNLGDALAAHGIFVAAGGERFAFAVACRGSGVVSVTQIPTVVLPHSCLVWDAGSDLHAADAMLASLMRQAQHDGGRILVLSPFASPAAYARGERLTPVVLWGQGIRPGRLFSASTRRPGLVTNTDFAPAVAALFGAPAAQNFWLPSPAFGQPWSILPDDAALPSVLRLQTQAYRQAKAMRMLPFVAIFLGLIVLAGSFAAYKRRDVDILTSAPLILVSSLLLSASVEEWLVWLSVLTILMIVLTRRYKTRMAMLCFCGLIVGLLAGDMLMGDPLMRRSLLGYSAVEGARYYGIGNESMGVLIGAALVLSSLLWQISRTAGRAAIALGLLGIIILLALPVAGAKAGSVFVAIPSFGVLLWQLAGRHIRWQAGLGLALATLAAMLLLVLLDTHLGGGSHIGRAAIRITQGGRSEAADIVTRKLAVEGRLLYHSAWAIPLWAGIGSLFLWRQRALRLPPRRPLLTAAIVAVATSLAFNDAGTVAAALCLAIVGSGMASSKNDTAG